MKFRGRFIEWIALIALFVPVLFASGCGSGDGTLGPANAHPAGANSNLPGGNQSGNTLNKPAPDFTVRVNPTLVSLTTGGTAANSTVTIGSANGFAGPVSLTLRGVPNGVTATLNTSSVTTAANGQGTATLSLAAAAGAPAVSSATVTINAASGSLQHSATFSLTVVAASSGKIIYINRPAGSEFNIYLANADGSNPVNLSGNPTVSDKDPRFSPDGSRIVFRRRVASGEDLWIMNADGTDQKKIVLSGIDIGGNYGTSPVVTPDGQKLVFALNGRIVSANLDGSNARYLTDGSSYASSPDLNPVNGTIVFSAGQAGATSLYTMTMDGSNLHALPNTVNFYNPRFNRSGTQLVCMVSLPTANPYVYSNNIVVMHADGSEQVQLTTNGKSLDPAFTGSGRIVFDDASQIYVMDATAGASPTALTTSGGTFPDSL